MHAAARAGFGHGSEIVVVIGILSVGIDLEAVEVGEVAVAGNAGLAMLVIKLVVAGRGPVERFKSAIRQVERLLKVRILAYLVLQISERSRRASGFIASI